MGKTVAVEVEITTKDAQKNIEELNKSLDASKDLINDLEKEAFDLEKQLDKTPKNQLAAQKELKDKLVQTKKAIKEEKFAVKDIGHERNKYAKILKENSKEQTKSIDTSQLLNTATGGLTGRISGMIAPLKGLNLGLKGFRLALASTGIGLIVIALGSLISYFTNTQRGADQLSQAVAGISAAFDVVKDRISTVGEALTLLFSGKPSEAFDKLKESVSGLTEEIKDEAAAAVQLAKDLQAVDDLENSLIESTAKRRKEISRLRLVAEDENLSIQKRIDALDEAGRIESEILDEELRIAKERARISKEQLALGESSREEIKANEEAQAKVFELQEKSLNFSKSLTTRRNALIKQGESQRKAEIKSFQDDTNAIDKILGDSITKNTFNEIKTTNAGIENLKSFKREKDKERRDDLKQTQYTEEQKIAAKRFAVESAIQLFGAETAAGKAALVLKQIMNAKELIEEVKKTITFASLSGARSTASVAEGTAQTAKIGFPQNIPMLIGYGIQAVGIISAVKSAISSTKKAAKGKGGSIPVPSYRATSTAAAPRPVQLNTVGSSGINQLAQTIQGQTQAPIKAYVVSSEVTTAQSLDRNIVREAGI